MTTPDRFLAIALAAVVLAACGGDDADDTADLSSDGSSDGSSLSTVVRSQASLAVADDAQEQPPAPDASGAPTSDVPEDERFPDVLAVETDYDDDSETWTFVVTMSSPYDTPERYADGWRVVGPDGTVYGIHTLAHDHAAEQPFTRRQTSVVIPEGVDEVTIEGRDQIFGFGGDTVSISLQTG